MLICYNGDTSTRYHIFCLIVSLDQLLAIRSFSFHAPFDGNFHTLVFQISNIFWKFSFLFITSNSECHSTIVIFGFKFVLRRPKVILSWICAAYLYLIHKTFLETVSRPLGNLLCLYNYTCGLVAPSFGKVICCYVWLLCFSYLT